MQKFDVVRILALIPLFVLGCSRAVDQQTSKIKVVIPESVSAKGLSAQAVDTSNMCFAVNVHGPGIGGGINECGVPVGVSSSFIKTGGEISLEVPMGSNRTIQLLRYEMNAATDTCPALDLSNCSVETSTLCEVYPSGEANVDINSPVVQVPIQLNMTSSSSVATRGPCAKGEIKALLLTSGEVVIGDQETKDPKRVAITLNGNQLESWRTDGKSDTGLVVPMFIRSVTRKPDNLQLFGLKSGQGDFDRMVSLNGAGGYQTLPLGGDCPFDTCQVPKWIQSVSAGYGTSLFGLDAGGGVYKLGLSAPQRVKTINTNVEQVVVY